MCIVSVQECSYVGFGSGITIFDLNDSSDKKISILAIVITGSLHGNGYYWSIVWQWLLLRNCMAIVITEALYGNGYY
jgi:hypothetical protein